MSEYISTFDRLGEFVVEFRGTAGRVVHEEIVRCRDCEHVHHRPAWQPDKRFKPKDLWICEAEWCMGFEGDHPCVEPDGFCWLGRRADEKAE